MTRRAPRLLVATYAAGGAFGVHALRYALEPSASADAGHGYLGTVPPLLAAVLAIALAQGVAATFARRTADRRPLHWLVRWALGTLVFVALFAAQENAEELLSVGHGAGPLSLFGHGGWLVGPEALVAGGVLVGLLRGTERALERIELLLTAAAPLAPWLAAAAPLPPVAAELRVPAVALLARNLAGRAPPRPA
jgi:hypothetical protein